MAGAERIIRRALGNTSAMGATQPPSQEKLGRADFVRLLFRSLDSRSVCYCVLHSYEGLPDKLLGDIDLVVHPADVSKLRMVLHDIEQQGYRPVQCVNYGVRGYYIVFVWFEGQNLNSVAIDITDEHRERGLILATGESLLAGRQRRGDFWVPDPSTEFAYLLSKKALKGTVPAHQEERLKDLVESLGRRRAIDVAKDLFGKVWARKVVEACANDSVSHLLAELKTRLWWTTFVHDPLNPVRYRLADVVRSLGRWFRPTGFFVAVVGPDGVGKSTLIDHLIPMLRPAFLRQTVSNWRPGWFWRLKGTAVPVTNPHAKPNYSAWFSVARLFAHVMDYLFGYLFLIRPRLTHSTLVVFDRYFHDMLVDSRRYRYGGPRWLLKAVYPLIPKPDLLLVLDAPEELILSRKQEVKQEELSRQRQSYLKIAKDRPLTFVIDASRPLALAGAEVTGVVIAILHERFKLHHPSHLVLREKAPQNRGFTRGIQTDCKADGLSRALEEFVGHVPTARGRVLPSANGIVSCVVSGARSWRVAKKLAGQGYARAHCFGVLPSLKAPRWLLPLGDKRTTRMGLEIYNPYAPTARLRKRLLSGVIEMGWEGWARYRVLIATKEQLALESLVHQITGEQQPAFALSLGTPGRYRKLTVQVMRPNGDILGYLKLPLTESAVERIRHEAQVLQQLWDFSVLRLHIPKILYAGQWENNYILFESAGPSRPGPLDFGLLHEEFLQTLRSVLTVEKPGRVLVDEVATRWRKAAANLNSNCQELGEMALEQSRLELGSATIPCGIMHGDFAPWNTRMSNGQLFLFDWEAAEWPAPILWDVFHFHSQVESLVYRGTRKNPPLNRAPGDRATYQLYLLNSLCQTSKEDGPSTQVAMDYRYRQLSATLL
jgi:thymidylate kinase